MQNEIRSLSEVRAELRDVAKAIANDPTAPADDIRVALQGVMFLEELARA